MTTDAVVRRDLLGTIARRVAQRYVASVRALDRLDALDGRSGPLASEELREDESARAAVARELVGRLVRIAGDDRLETPLRALAGAPQRSRELAAALQLQRLVLRRRVDELIDAGLVEHDPNTDQLSPTALGSELLELLDELRAGVVAALREGPR